MQFFQNQTQEPLGQYLVYFRVLKSDFRFVCYLKYRMISMEMPALILATEKSTNFARRIFKVFWCKFPILFGATQKFLLPWTHFAFAAPLESQFAC